jgi:hypothetical protein
LDLKEIGYVALYFARNNKVLGARSAIASSRQAVFKRERISSKSADAAE